MFRCRTLRQTGLLEQKGVERHNPRRAWRFDGPAGTALFGTLAFVPLFVQVSAGVSATSAGQILTPLYLMASYAE